MMVADLLVLRRVGACDESRVPGRGDPVHDASTLFGRLTLTKDDFRDTTPQMPVLIDAREAQVLVRTLAQELKELLVRCLRCSVTRPHGVEEGTQLLTVHHAKWLKCIDFGPSWTIT